ncbi:NUDIX hydrolase [Chitiniphilus shinanonensis]|uniref:NUDIX hydrolase n=1 Tax=Chitiniphilus shinanonensis TaxID=553088 RepID=UPI00303C5E94
MPAIEVVTLATLRHGRLLTVRKRGTTRFMLPGGKPEPGESPLQSLIRELDEELGCAPDPAQLQMLGCFSAAAANEPGRIVRATVYLGPLTGEPRRRAEIDELAWIDPAAPHLPLAPLLQQAVLPALLRRLAEAPLSPGSIPRSD